MSIRARWLSYFLALVLPGCTLQAQQAQKPPSPPPAQSVPVPGTLTNGVYRNTTFGFTCKVPFGWVERTHEMSEDSSGDSNAHMQSILLLAVFEHPPEATGVSVNSAIVIAAEAASSYPGLRNAEQYFGPLTELIKSKGLSVVSEPYEFRVGTIPLVRGDFSKPLGNLTIRQSTLVLIAKGYIVSFTFIGGSENQVDELVEGLSFGRKDAPPPHK